MNFKNAITIVVFIFISAMLPAQGGVLDGITTALKTGNASLLANDFDNSVEITIVNNDDVYSKSQAEMILKKFFNSNPPKSFKFIHQGNSAEGSHYGIGNYLSTEGGNFRTYVYVKQKDNQYKIQEIRFEND